LTVIRAGEAAGALPKTLRIEDGVRTLAIDRVRVVRGRTDPRSLGTGVPTERLRVRPLSTLSVELAREPDRAGGER